MGVSYSKAKWMAPASLVVDVAAQVYGVTSTPNMMDINNQNQSFWSPHPAFIAAFFAPQQVLQLVWLYRLWKLDPNRPNERKEVDEMVDYVPYYALGNICLAVWMIFWNSEHLQLSNVFVVINGLVQLYYMFTQLRPMDTRSTTSVLTNICCRTFAGIAWLDLLHNGSIAYFKDMPPNLAVKAITGVLFGLLGTASDWIFGGCLVYDLVALAVGQSGSWRLLLGVYAVGTAGIVTAKNILRPPYNKEGASYSKAATDDIQDRV